MMSLICIFYFLYFVSCILLLVFCFLYSASYILLLVFCFLYSASCILLLIFCFLYSASCILLLVFCFLYSASYSRCSHTDMCILLWVTRSHCVACTHSVVSLVVTMSHHSSHAFAHIQCVTQYYHRTMHLHSVDWSKDCITIYITNYNEHQVNIYEVSFEFWGEFTTSLAWRSTSDIWDLSYFSLHDMICRI